MRNLKRCANSAMKILSWNLVGMNQTREKLRSRNLHLTKKSWGGREKEGDAFGGRPLLEGARVPGTFSGTVFRQHWRLPFTDVCCAFCGKKCHLEKELLKHLSHANWSSMLEFRQKRRHIIVKFVSASLGSNITYIVIKEGKIGMRKVFCCHV